MDLDQQLEQIAAHITAQQKRIIERWRSMVTADADLSTPDSLSRAQFVDHVPEILDALARALSQGRAAAVEAAVDEAQSGAGHGMHRWQQGYSQIELMREWSHLQLALIDELQELTARLSLDARTLHSAYRTMARFCSEAMSESTVRYESMYRAEAAGQANDLARTLGQARLLERRQADILRGAAHDLRGNLGIVANVAQALQLEGLSTERRGELFALAQRALTAHTGLLTDLMDLARLQAGQERRVFATLDVAPVLRELCELAKPSADSRGLALEFTGPASFIVDADRVKLSRIVQNLLLNALHYTREGSVKVTWGDSRDNDPKRWMVCIQDTGPGLQQGPAAPLADALQEATQEVMEVEPDDSSTAAELDDASSSGSPSRGSDPHRHGEGIGLSIVKRLCELLDSSLEMESEPGTGTVVRVVMPRHYAAPKAIDRPAAKR